MIATLGLPGLLTLGFGVSAATAAKGTDTISLTMLANGTGQAAFNLLIPNFERVHPNIAVNVTYGATITDQYELTTTELAAGNGPDLFVTWPGCGTPISVCELAKAGDLAPMVNKPWVRRSLPLVTSESKYGPGLYVFSQTLTVEGIFTNDTLFGKLGLKVPQTFSQLLNVCQEAKADGTIPMLLPAEGSAVVQQLLADIALTTVYAKNRQWGHQLQAGKVTFDGTPGWHAALQELVDMNNEGCFEPGPAGTTSASADEEFAQGQALMYVNLTSHKGAIAAGEPQFVYSQHPFPAGDDPAQTRALLNLGTGPSVDAHSSAQNQAAAQTFVDFLARPKQDALYAQITGGVTQYEFLKGEIPAYLSSFAPLFKEHEYGVNPVQTWWNPIVGNALTMYGTGLLTGQESIDDVLNAMDAAWKQGPG